MKRKREKEMGDRTINGYSMDTNSSLNSSITTSAGRQLEIQFTASPMISPIDTPIDRRWENDGRMVR